MLQHSETLLEKHTEITPAIMPEYKYIHNTHMHN